MNLEGFNFELVSDFALFVFPERRRELETRMIRLILALAMVSAWLLATPVGVSSARAQVNININIGKGGITCSQGRRIVERRGFRNVRARTCQGRTFVYSGRRSGINNRIDVRRRDGRITSIRRR
jgi:hypothetical protein